MEKKSVLLLVNHGSRQGEAAFEMARQELERQGLTVIAPEKADPGCFTELITEHASKIDRVVVGGGDGSIRCAVDGALKYNLPLGILPLGTANNLARNLQIPTDLAQACVVAATGVPRPIDVGEVNGIPFLNVVGLGLSTQVNRVVPSQLKKKLGVVAYGIMALKHYKKLKPFRARVLCDNGRLEMTIKRVLQMHICNGRHFGSGLTIHADATIEDGTLDLAITEAVDLFKGFKIAREFLTGAGDRQQGLHRVRAKELVIETKRPMSLDVDGDLATKTPARFIVRPAALQVLAPAEGLAPA